MKKKIAQQQLDVTLEESASVELVTPEMAVAFLNNNPANRPLSEDNIRLYAREIEKERWFVNNNGIGICEDGTLMDGQHRLNAIVKSNQAQRMVVVRNMKKAAFATIDTGRKRTTSDMLSIRGVPYYTHVSNATRICYILDDGKESRGQTTFSGGKKSAKGKYVINDLLEYIDNNTIIITDVSHCMNFYPSLIKTLGISPTCALFHLFAKRDRELALEMFGLLNSRAIGDPNSVLLKCSNLLIKYRQSMNGVRSFHIGYPISLVVRTWNFLRDGLYDERLVQDYSLPIPVIK